MKPVVAYDLGEDSDKIIDFQEIGKGFTIDLDAMKESETYWFMCYGQTWNFGKKDGKLQFWEPEPIFDEQTTKRRSK